VDSHGNDELYEKEGPKEIRGPPAGRGNPMRKVLESNPSSRGKDTFFEEGSLFLGESFPPFKQDRRLRAEEGGFSRRRHRTSDERSRRSLFQKREGCSAG